LYKPRALLIKSLQLPKEVFLILVAPGPENFVKTRSFINQITAIAEGSNQSF
jgi:hypothetical protein